MVTEKVKYGYFLNRKILFCQQECIRHELILVSGKTCMKHPLHTPVRDFSADGERKASVKWENRFCKVDVY